MASPYQKLAGGYGTSFSGERLRLLLGPDHVLAVRMDMGGYAERYYLLNYRDLTAVTVTHRKGPRVGLVVFGIVFCLLGLLIGALTSAASAVAGIVVGALFFVPGVIVAVRAFAVQWAALNLATAVHRIDLPGLLPLNRALAIQSRIAERATAAQPAPPPAAPGTAASEPAAPASSSEPANPATG